MISSCAAISRARRMLLFAPARTTFQPSWRCRALGQFRFQAILNEMAEMFDQREPIDLVTLRQRLKDKKLLEEVGGIAYINSFRDLVPTPAHIGYYLNIVIDKWLLRKMVHVCTSVVSQVYEFEGEVDSLMDEVERDILRISESRVQGQTNTIKEVVKGGINTSEGYDQRQGMVK